MISVLIGENVPTPTCKVTKQVWIAASRITFSNLWSKCNEAVGEAMDPNTEEKIG